MPPLSRKGFSAAKVDLLHFGVVTNFLCCALRNQAASGQYDDAIGKTKNHIHAVLCEQHCHAALGNQLARQRHQFKALGRGHPCGGLVHQQQARLVGHGHGQFQSLDVAIGQLAAGPPCLLCQADLRQQGQRIGSAVQTGSAPHGEQTGIV